jgi:hypothetical protein
MKRLRNFYRAREIRIMTDVANIFKKIQVRSGFWEDCK